MAQLDPQKCIVVPLAFYQADCTASQAGVEIDAPGEATAGDAKYYVMPWAGSVIGVSIGAEAARSAGTLTIQPSVDGTADGPSAALGATNTQYHYASARRGQYTFAAGAKIGAIVTTDASWAAGTTPSILVTVFVHVEEY